MKLLLVTASSQHIKNIRKTRVINFQQITMPYLAARIPDSWEVEHIDEEMEQIDVAKKYDLVAFTFHTPSANHVYQIAKQFQRNGVTVVLGGPHVTLMPEEAQQHGDVIFIGESEGIWEQFLLDYEAGNYQSVYTQEKVPDLTNLPQSKKQFFHRKDYSNGVLFATRGCPNTCDFCALAAMYKNKYRKRPVEEVAAEYASFKGKVIIFWDDNIVGDNQYAKQLFKALIPYKKWWSSQTSIDAGKDDEVLELAAKSGCKQLFFGIESINQNSLQEVNKSWSKVNEYKEIIRRVQSYGISVQVGIIFGFDHDTKNVFKETLDFLEDVGVQNATFNMLTPYPGTALFKRLDEEGRILTYDWSKYNGRVDVVYQPKNMTAEELQEGFQYANQRFYSLKSITKRLAKAPFGLWWNLPLNLAYWASYKKYRYDRFNQQS